MKQVLALIILFVLVSCASQKDAKYLQQGKTEMSNQRFEQALELFTKSINQNPARAEAYFARGLSYNMMQNYEAAVTDFSMAEKLGYSEAKLYSLRSFAYSMTDRNELALKDLNKAITLDPESYAGNYYNRAMLYNTLRKPDSAVADLNKYLTVAQDPNAFFQRGKIVLTKGDLKSACEDFKKAVSLGNTDAELLKISEAICK